MVAVMSTRPVSRIVINHIRDTVRACYARGGSYPACRGASKHAAWPHWNVQYAYRLSNSRQSFYWCDECLPAKYRQVADSMLRGGETRRVLEGATAEDFRTTPQVSATRHETGSTIPWRRLL